MNIKKSLMGFLFLTGFSATFAFATGEICRNNIVYGNNGSSELVGRVLHVYQDMAEVRWLTRNGVEYVSTPRYWPVNQLSRQEPSLGSFTHGTPVYGTHSGKNLVGVVNRVFANGRAEVRWTIVDGRPITPELRYWNITDLRASTSPCATTGCTDQ